MVKKAATDNEEEKESAREESAVAESDAKGSNPFEALISIISPEHRTRVTAATIIFLGLFAIWSSIPDSIKESVLLSMFRSDPVADYGFDGAQVLVQDVTLDLSNWRELSDTLRTSIAASPALWTYKIRARKTRPIDSFYREIYTSGLEPHAVCLTHPFTYKEVPYTPSPRRETLRKFLLTADISGVDENDEFDIEFLFIYWNGFQNTTKEWASQLIKYPTDQVTFTVRFPEHKPFRDFDVESYSKRDASVGTYSGAAPTKTSDRQVTWKIDRPNPFYSYRLVWEW